jgi:phosphatidylglycerol---prolipoprotein diacylglyceryl transferase
MNFVWDLDPTLFALGPLSVRYYGLIFVITLLGGFYLWRWQTKRAGWCEDDISAFLAYGVVGTIVGARLGHVFFYEPGRYLADPISILYIWKGGLASHGATIGLIIVVFMWARKYKMPFTEALDRFSFSAALGAAMVRLGNFFNSEIVGRLTDQTWGVRFPRFDGPDAPLRHPSQLYEFTMGLTVLGALLILDKIFKEKRPRGILGASFLGLYFTGRFFVEFFKEYQTVSDSFPLTMGQMLSIPFALFGYTWAVVAWKRKIGPATPPAKEEPARTRRPKKKRVRKKR